MTVSIDSAVRRRRMAFRAWHRGTREMDLILGRFSDSELAGLSAADLDAFEALMEWPDTDLYRWVTGDTPPPAAVDTALFARLRAFHSMAGSTNG
jgi:antitoxin CptB